MKILLNLKSPYFFNIISVLLISLSYRSVEEIERIGDLKNGFELDFARIDGALEEVLEERQLGYREPKSYNNDRLKSNTKQSNSLLPDDEYFSLEGLTLSDRQRKAIDKLDMANQLSIIKKLREEQGVERPKAKPETPQTSPSELDILREKVDKANREIKVANNEHSETKTDASVDRGRKEDEYTGNKYKQPTLSPNEVIYNYLNDNFYTTLGYKESSNDYKKRLNDNQGVGAVGKYQFRKPAFQETGFMDKNGNFTGKDGINSVNDFIHNPKIQEKAVRELLKRNYNYMIKYKVQNLLGNTLSGKVADFPITISGILAASHKEGGPMTAKYLKSLEKNKDGLYYLPYHKYKGNTLRSFLAIETRLREFSKLNTDN